jgi:hypothetical protein
MFKCDVTGKLSQPREKSYKVVTKTRNKTYQEKRYNQEEKEEYFVTFEGQEIVEELTVCEEVYLKMKGTNND